MNHKAIVLWDSKANAKIASDDACTTILQYELPRAPSTIHPPYQSPHPPDVKLRYVPPLAYFCINALAEYPDEIHALGAARLRYEAPWSRGQFDILSALIPSYCPFDDSSADDFDLSLLDPRLWAVIIQAYEGLPPKFRHYRLPLSDAYVPLLQTIPSTKHFSLITTLSLTRCKMLTDNTILELRHLHTLVALDVSITAVGTWGISRLAKSLAWSEAEAERSAERRGPWGLRILDLRDCINVDDKVFHWLLRFPLLSVVDLRGTVCKPWRNPNIPFKACADTRLYYPAPPSAALDCLVESTDTQKKPLFSHPKPFVLNINALHHKAAPAHPTRHPLNDLYRNTDDSDHRPVEFIGRRKDVFLPYERPRQRTAPSEVLSPILPARPPSLRGDSDQDDETEPSGDESDRSDYSSDGHHSPQPPGPWNMDDDPWEEGLVTRSPRLEPQSDDETNWMIDVAEDEGRKYLRQRDAVMFYAQPPAAPRRAASLSTVAAAPRYAQNQGTADPLMLFRPPPPWSALPTAPPAKPASKAASSSTTALHGMPDSVFGSGSAHELKRKRGGLGEEASAKTDEARRRMHALSSIQGLVSMVHNRGEGSKAKEKENAGEAAKARMVMPGRVNPFARTAQAGRQKEAPTLKRKTTDPSPARAPPMTREDSSRSSRPSMGAKARPSTSEPTVTCQPQAAPLPSKVGAPARTGQSATAAPSEQTPSATETPRPSKKLKPITSLTVPDWPNAGHKPVSHHAPKPKPPPPKAQAQTTLSASRSAAKPADKGKEKRQVSAPVGSTPRLAMVVKAKPGTTVGKKGEADKAPSKGEKGKEKGGAKFDWKSWGGG